MVTATILFQTRGVSVATKPSDDGLVQEYFVIDANGDNKATPCSRIGDALILAGQLINTREVLDRIHANTKEVLK